MTAPVWMKLDPENFETCASVSCGHSPAAWRMEAAGTGSFYCEACHTKIAGREGPSFTQDQILRRVRRALGEARDRVMISQAQYDALYDRMSAPFIEDV